MSLLACPRTSPNRCFSTPPHPDSLVHCPRWTVWRTHADPLHPHPQMHTCRVFGSSLRSSNLRFIHVPKGPCTCKCAARDVWVEGGEWGRDIWTVAYMDSWVGEGRESLTYACIGWMSRWMRCFGCACVCLRVAPVWWSEVQQGGRCNWHTLLCSLHTNSLHTCSHACPSPCGGVS